MVHLPGADTEKPPRYTSPSTINFCPINICFHRYRIQRSLPFFLTSRWLNIIFYWLPLTRRPVFLLSSRPPPFTASVAAVTLLLVTKVQSLSNHYWHMEGIPMFNIVTKMRRVPWEINALLLECFCRSKDRNTFSKYKKKTVYAQKSTEWLFVAWVVTMYGVLKYTRTRTCLDFFFTWTYWW